ncbi:MAG: hypothetical protein KKE55_05805 [Candidatus Omnitrophica bacterium]|nr:hypothetical protein [Candidatus Omnitrophota bacterium]
MDKKTKTEIIIIGFLVAILIILSISMIKKKKPSLKVATVTSLKEQRKDATPAPVAPVAVKAEDATITLQKARAELSWGRDPFFLTKTESAKVYQGTTLSIKGISFGKDKQGYALINDKIVTVGDTVDDYEVIEIDRNSVLLKKGNESLHLSLSPQ